MENKLEESIEVLKFLNNSITEITRATLVVFRNFHTNPSEENTVIMYSVYGFLIIKVSAFYDELKSEFKEFSIEDKALTDAIAHFNELCKIYELKKLRNYIAHHRKQIRKDLHLVFTDDDILSVSKIKSHTEFEAFSVASNRIIKSLEKFHVEH